MDTQQPLWKPSKSRRENSRLNHYISYLAKTYDLSFADYPSLYNWSLAEKELFWSTIWDYCGIIGDKGTSILENGDDIERALWFSDSRLNFAENLLQKQGDEVAIYFRTENKIGYNVTWNQLHTEVAAVAHWMKLVGIAPGDRVAGYLPNIPEAVVAMLAATSLGAIWTSTSPDFGTQSVVERFAQTQPKILISVDGYYYGGKTIDLRKRTEDILKDLPTVEQSVTIRFIGLGGEIPGIDWLDVLSKENIPFLSFQRVEFNAPLYILYSSGTTGKPKCIVHKVGGVLLQLFKELQLHSDVHPGDRVFYFTTCGWMMWNWLVTSLGCGASIVLYDGSPFYPDGNVLWDYAEETNMTLFGTSAKYIDAIKKQGLRPVKSHDLSSLKTLCSTGSVLAPESFEYVYRAIKRDLNLASISGGTDIVSCFVQGSPILPVYRGEIQCRALGMAVEVYDEEGNSLVGEKGELVCTSTFPSQPAFFWGDPTGEKYHDAYFARFDGVWHHGDYVKLSHSGGVTIYGRSDATLNPGGVRIGTAEIYRYVEQLDTIVESIAVGQEWEGDIRIVLFVVLQAEAQLNDDLKQEICDVIRQKCSPRHVPAKILVVDEIPRTKSGKIVELAVREVIHGREVKNIGALANPETLQYFKERKELTR